MTVSCSNCSASLQVDESKISSERFAVRCPKCQQTINVQLKNNGNNQLNNNQTDSLRSWETKPAVAYQRKSGDETTNRAPDVSQDLLRLLSNALQQNNSKTPTAYKPQQFKRVLLCFSPERCEIAAQILDDHDFQVFLAENPAQATEKIRDEEVDIIIFSPDFALKFNGASVVQQMLQKLAPRERRQIFVVSVEESSQTFNTHDAFMRNLNLIVNVSDLHHLPSILSRALRDYDELYRHYNLALSTLD